VLATLLALTAPAARALASDVIYTTADNGTSIATVDPSTGTGAVLGPTGYSNVFAAALDTDGTLWTIVDGFTTAQIATVDKTTGHATPAPNPIGTPMITLEVGADGTLYGIGYSDQRLYRIDKATGVGTPVGPATGIATAMDTAFDCDGHLWVTANGQVWTVDTTTGAATAKPSITGVSGGPAMVMGLMFDSSCRMLATTYMNPGDLYAIDPATGAATLIGTTGLNMPHGGSIRTFVPDTQAPTTTDDVQATFRNAPQHVTLTASDGTGSGVARIYCTIGTDPPAPTTASQVYDPEHKPTLAHGEKIRYFAVDQRGNAEPEHSSAAAKVDTQAPTTTDDVPAGVRQLPVAVTLSATDSPTTQGDFSGVAAIHYEIGSNPADPSTASPRYDPANKPILKNGEKIRYFAVDAAGNAETAKTSSAAQVQAPAVTKTSRRKVTIHLRSRYNRHAVRSVRATIDGRKAKVARAGRGYRVVVDMRGHACTPVKVRIKIALAGAPKFTLRRTFTTCAPRH
jgi:hypothetical protein